MSEERGSFYDAFLAFRENVICFILLPTWEISGLVGRYARERVDKSGDRWNAEDRVWLSTHTPITVSLESKKEE